MDVASDTQEIKQCYTLASTRLVSSKMKAQTGCPALSSIGLTQCWALGGKWRIESEAQGCGAGSQGSGASEIPGWAGP